MIIHPLSLSAEIHYVDADAAPGGNGSEWATAFNYLQDALATASGGDEIRVAAGVYYPDDGNGQTDNDREATFQLKSGVTLLGAFPAGGGDLSERDNLTHITVLSGDIDQNDEDVFQNDQGNSYHVVNGTGVDETAILDGFYVTAGRADGSGSNRRGGGMFCTENSSPTIRNCAFISNFAEIGGGFYNCSNSSPSITNSAFVGNWAVFGGGMYNCIDSTPVLTNCLLFGNRSNTNGGAIYNDLNASSTYINCTFTGNRSNRTGGAVYNTRGSSPEFINCIIWNNSEDGSTHTPGASVDNDDESFPTYSYSLVANSGGSGGWNAVLGIDSGDNIDVDPLFLDNVDPALAPIREGNLRLSERSPAINAGLNPDLPTAVDIQGDPRIQKLVIDLGAYESSFDLPLLDVLYVDASADGQADGLSWETAFTNLQDALQAAASGYTLYVAAATYYPDEGANVVDNDRLATFQLKSGVALLGGFPAGGGDLAERNPATHLTWLSGDIDQNDGPDFTGNSGNSFIVVNASDVDSSAVLDGFVITAGNSDGSGSLQTRGGGLSIQQNGSPTIRNCVFRRNYGSIGGAFYSCADSFPIIENCLFIGNSANFGGAVFNCIRSSPSFTNCAFQGNYARLDGGAVYNDITTAPTFHNASFSGNRADRRGGVFYNTRSSLPILVNCIIWNNSLDGSITSPVASVENDDSSFPEFSNCLVANSGGSGNWNTSIGIDKGGNIDADPLFILESDPSFAPSIFGSLRLTEGSPALNSGTDSVTQVDTDLAGDPRVQDSMIDLGAYEGAFTARFTTFYPGLDPELDDNGNGLANFYDYASGADPLDFHNPDTLPELSYSGDSLLLTLNRRTGVDDITDRVEASPSLAPDSWSRLEANTDFEFRSINNIGNRQIIILELPASPTESVFYRQSFSGFPVDSSPAP